MRAPKAPLTRPEGIWKKWPSVESNVADNDRQGRPSTAQPRVLFNRSMLVSSQQKNDWRSCGSKDKSKSRNKYLSAVSYTHLTLPTICSV